MINTETIQAIKAEIERMKKANEISENENYAQYELDVACGYDMACDDFLSFLDTFKEPVCDELEEEIQRMVYNLFFDLEGIAIAGTSIYATVDDMAYIARHFAEWQKAQDNKMVDIIYQQGIEKGKDDMREQMMKGAVEGTLSSTITGSEQTVYAYVGYGEYGKDGDKVRIIIVKED